ncbi:MAG: VOC family protein [Deltaproteobacteria bacterium]|nr:VOC family protein [Deltaproteobacteria bacterium]
MINTVQHFAINADDLPRARAFYENVFGWRFEAWGPPDFFQIVSGTDDAPGIRGALQKRREIAPGKKIHGFECTVAVADIDAVIASVREAGGTILMEKSVIAGVGTLVFFADPEGNAVGAMQYDFEIE